MAQRHASALKAYRQSERRRLINRKNVGKAKSAARTQRALIAKGDAAAAEKAIPATQSAIDTAAGKGVISKNAASRRKSRLAKKVNALKSGADTARK